MECAKVLVCWCVCWCWDWCVTLTSPPPLHHKHIRTPSPRVHVQNAPVCTGTTPASVTTCGRGAGTHGVVLNVHTRGVLSATPRNTHTPRPQRHTQHNNHHHNNTRRQRDREKKRQDKTREEKKRKKREDERENKRQVENKEKRWKRKWRERWIEMKEKWYFCLTKCLRMLSKVWHCFDQDSRPAECACSVSMSKMSNLLNDSYWKQTHATCTAQHADDWRRDRETGQRIDHNTVRKYHDACATTPVHACRRKNQQRTGHISRRNVT